MADHSVSSGTSSITNPKNAPTNPKTKKRGFAGDFTPRVRIQTRPRTQEPDFRFLLMKRMLTS